MPVTHCPPPVWEYVSVDRLFGNIESLSTLLDLSKPLTITSILQCLLLSHNSTIPLGLINTLDISLVVIVAFQLSSQTVLVDSFMFVHNMQSLLYFKQFGVEFEA
jgi:hypothetical protein